MPQDIAGAYVRCAIRSPSRVAVRGILNKHFEELGTRLKSISDLITLEKFIKATDLDDEDADIIDMSRENHEVVFGVFRSYC